MGLTADKICKLRELAERGVGGEKENAKSILKKNGIDWEKPKESLVDTIKEKLGANITKDVYVSIQYSTDVLLVEVILYSLKLKTKLLLTANSILLRLKNNESKQVLNLFYKNRVNFYNEQISFALNSIEL